MITILAIETSSESASVALLQGERILTRAPPAAQNHSETMLPMVQELLAEAGIRLGQCDAIAFGAGPGSFTGVRTACGIVQGLAFGADLPVIPVSTLLALAEACRNTTGASDVLALLDARMGEVYWAQYRHAGSWRTVVAPTLSAPADVAPQGRVVACGNGLSAYPEAFRRPDIAAQTFPALMPHAAQVASLAALAYARCETLAARDAQPIYLRNQVALTSAERLAKVGR